MKKSILFAGVLFLSLTACQNKAELKSDKQKVSYLMGMNSAEGIKRSGIELDAKAFLAGVEDTLKNMPPRLNEADMKMAMQRFQTMMMEQRKKRFQEQAGKDPQFQKMATENKQKGEAFLVANKKKKGVKVTATGLQYKVVKPGKGKKPAASDKVQVHYEGKLIGGKVFDSSYKRGQPAEFPVNGVIKGWIEALQMMKEGGKWQLYIPANLAYGLQGPPSIGPNQVLIFDVELKKVL